MPCKKCKKEMPAGAFFCPWCGADQKGPARKKRTRPNGSGTAYKRGKTWEARVIIGWEVLENGKLKPIPRTKSGFATKREALEYCPTLKKQALPPKKKRVRAEGMTYKALYDAVIKRLEDRERSKQTVACYRAAMNYFAPLHHIDIRIIGVDDLQDCMDDCPKGKRTKENMKTIAGLICKYAMERDIIEKNYADFLFTGNGKKGTRPPFTLDETETIRKAVGIVPYADYVYFMIYSGYRPAELLSRQKAQYDDQNKCIWGGAKTDAGKDRAVTISPKILPILKKQLLTPGELLFPRIDTGEEMSTDYFRDYCFAPCMEALGITDRVPYSARHAFANLLKLVSGSDTDKASLMGHTDASMTKKYQSADLSSLQQITDII